jgi:hypothetical protein
VAKQFFRQAGLTQFHHCQYHHCHHHHHHNQQSTSVLRHHHHHHIAQAVSVQFKDAKSYAPDEAVLSVVTQHQALLTQVMKTQLFAIRPASDGAVFSSQQMRVRPTSVGSFICNVIRKALRVDCALMNAGAIRGNKSYSGQTAFYYSNLITELPFETRIVVVEGVPAKVLLLIVIIALSS